MVTSSRMSLDVPGPGAVTAEEALARLRAGNERFVRGEARFPTMQKEILAELAKGQQPYTTILGCSDSRVPPELVFDAGFGELFIVRVAGNVVSPEVMGTLQYAAVHLRTPLFVVLGHEGCGAVQAALAAKFLGVRDRSRDRATARNHHTRASSRISAGASPDEQLLAGVEANVQVVDAPAPRDSRGEGPCGRGGPEAGWRGLRIDDGTRALPAMRAVMSTGHRTSLLLALLLAGVLTGSVPLLAQETTPPAAEAEVATAPVELDGAVLFRVRGVSSLPAAERARLIEERLTSIAADSTIPVDSLRAVELESASRIVAGDRPIMTVISADASLEQVSVNELAAVHVMRLRQAIAGYRDARSTTALKTNAL